MEHSFAEERGKVRSEKVRTSCNFMFDKILDKFWLAIQISNSMVYKSHYEYFRTFKMPH